MANPERISSLFQGDPFITSYAEADVYNDEGFNKEAEQLVLRLKLDQDSLATLPITINSPRDLKDHQNWLATQKKAWEVFRYLGTLDIPYQELVAKSLVGDELFSISDFCHYQILYIGGQLIIDNLLQQQLIYAKQHGFEDRYQGYRDLLAITYGVSRLDIRIGESSLREVLDMDPRKEGFAKQYRFLMETSLVGHRQTHDQIYKRNQSELFKRNPNTTKYLIECLAAEVRAALLSTSDIVADDIRTESGIPKEVAQKGLHFSNRIALMVEGFYSHLIQPDSYRLDELQQIVSLYLKGNKLERTRALHLMGLDRYDHIYQMFRAAKLFAESDTDTNFYKSLAESIKDFISSGVTDGIILQEEDIYEILESTPNQDNSLVTMASLKAIVSSIFSKGSQRVFTDIDPAILENTGITRPQQISITFDQNRPHKFEVFLSWQNQYGESTNVNLIFDTGKDIFDWNFLELPTDPEMRAMSNASLAATERILLAIYAQIDNSYNQRKLNEQERLTTQVKSKTRKDKTTDEVYSLRKQTRLEAKLSSVSKKVDFSEVAEELNVQRRILPLANQVFSKMLANISSNDRGNVIQAINRFNNQGVGAFTRKRAKGEAGETLYTLRIGNTRVLVGEVESIDKGIRNFEIIDIDDRSRIYKKRKI